MRFVIKRKILYIAMLLMVVALVMAAFFALFSNSCKNMITLNMFEHIKDSGEYGEYLGNIHDDSIMVFAFPNKSNLDKLIMFTSLIHKDASSQDSGNINPFAWQHGGTSQLSITGKNGEKVCDYDNIKSIAYSEWYGVYREEYPINKKASKPIKIEFKAWPSGIEAVPENMATHEVLYID